MTDDLKHQLGERVRAARKRAGISQEELASRIERHKDSISLIERGDTLPTLPMLLALADALDVPADELIRRNDLPGAPRKSAKRIKLEAEISELIREVPEGRLEFARDQLRLLAKLD